VKPPEESRRDVYQAKNKRWEDNMRNSTKRDLGRWRIVAKFTLALAALSAIASASMAEDAKKLRLVFVSPLGPGNQFMLPMIKGFQEAGQQLGMDVTFRGNQETNDFAAAPVVKRLLEDAIASKPDGLVISDQFPDVLNDDIKKAVAAGIPVVLTNGGYGQEGNTGALAFVGTAERDLGEIGAQKLCSLGSKNVLVITLPPGIPLVDLRMEGIAKGIAPCKTTIIQVPQETLFDATKLVNTMLVAVQKDPTIDGVFSLGSCCGPAMVAFVDHLGDKAKSMHFATIDLGAPVLDALKSGKIDFAIDQQQYLEGYMPVVMLNNYLKFSISPVDTFFRTGPGLVTKDNAQRIIELTAQNHR
jgi:simple sugar transport system substrate-binding protein